MGESILRDKSKEFAKNIVFLAQRIKDNKKEFVMTHQLLKSGTSIGANIHEAQYAQSSDDFVSKLEIALKECFETEYWLELLFDTNYIEKEEYDNFASECGRLRKMLISSCTTMKTNKTELF